MGKVIDVLDLKYNTSYTFHLSGINKGSFDRSYHGKEEIRGETFLKVRKLNGDFAPSLAISDLIGIEPLGTKGTKKQKRK